MKQRQPMGGGFFLLVLALTMLVVMWMRSPNNPLTAPAMTEQDVYVALENGTITKARIRPDAENSTGKLQLWLKSGDMEEVHVLNVSDFAEEFRDDGIPYEVEEIPKENYALTIMLPILLSAGLLAAFFHVYESEERRRRQCQDDEFRQKPSQDEPRQQGDVR